MRRRCWACSSAGGARRPRPGARSRASPSPSRPDATGSGWPAGCGRAGSRPMLSTRRAWPSRANTGERRRTGSIPRCSSASSSAGCAVSRATAPWRRSRPLRRKMRGGPERLDTLRTPEGALLPPNTLAELRRDMARLGFIVGQIKEIEDARQEGLATQPDQGPPAMVRLLARVIGIGIETADRLGHEILSRNLRDRRAVARYAGLTGSPDESGAKRREKGLAKAGNARVRRGMVQLAWRFLLFQKDSALAQWYRARTADARGGTRKTMIVALARKLLIALWRFVTTGEVPAGVVLRAA